MPGNNLLSINGKRRDVQWVYGIIGNLFNAMQFKIYNFNVQ